MVRLNSESVKPRILEKLDASKLTRRRDTVRHYILNMVHQDDALIRAAIIIVAGLRPVCMVNIASGWDTLTMYKVLQAPHTDFYDNKCE